MKPKQARKRAGGSGKQSDQPGTFVVRFEENQKTNADDSISAFGDVESLGESGLRIVRLTGSHADPRSTWKELQSQVNGLKWAAPALKSADGAEHYPTGTIGVRFVSEQTAKSLNAFARAHHLELVRRNEFVPSQATFAPDKPSSVFLPDRVREIAEDPSVQRAWAETISKYRRGKD